jgi:hypothetical protein
MANHKNSEGWQNRPALQGWPGMVEMVHAMRARRASRMKLTINIATRGRPELLKMTVERTLPNIQRADTTLMISADEDDQLILGCLGDLPLDKRMKFSVKPREDSRGAKYDRALTEAPADLYLPAVDCAPILTPGFDQILLDKASLFPDGIGVVHTGFGSRGTFPPALQAVTAKYVEKVGYIYNPEYPFWFIDHEVHDLARLIGRYFQANIHVETAPHRPAKTWRLRDLLFWTAYYDMMALERRAKARAIINGSDFQTPDWIKSDLLTNFQWIENGSWQINEFVRKNAASIEAQRGDSGPPDEGYVRAKARAEQKLSTFLEALKAAA